MISESVAERSSPGVQLVNKDNLRGGDVVIVGHGCQRISGNHFVKSPLIALVYGNFGDAFLVEIFAAGRQMQFEGSVGGCAHPQQAGIEVGDLLHRRFHQVGDQAQVNTVVRGDGVGYQRWVGRERLQSILLRDSWP